MATNIIKTQIKHKVSATEVDLVHPETETDIVINDSNAITGNTVTEVFDNSYTLSPGNNISITPNDADKTLTVAFTGSLAPNVVVQGTSPITVSSQVGATSATYTVAVNNATTSQKGVVQLSSATNSTLETTAATSKAVKTAYDLANGKQTAFSDGSGTIASVNTATGVLSISQSLTQNKGTVGVGTATLTTYTKDKIDALISSGVTYLGSCDTKAKILALTPGEAGDWARYSGSTVSFHSTTLHTGDIVIYNGAADKTAETSWDVIHTEVNTNTWRPVAADSGTRLQDSSTVLTISGDGLITTSIGGGTVDINSNAVAISAKAYSSNDPHITIESTSSGIELGVAGNFLPTSTTSDEGKVLKVGSDGTAAWDTDNDTTYTFSGGTNKITVTPSNGTAKDYTITPSVTITAKATDGLWDLSGTNGTNAVTYALGAYTTQQSKASFDTSTTNPTRTERLNYNGYFYATKLYSAGKEVLTGNQTITLTGDVSGSGATQINTTIGSGKVTTDKLATPTNADASVTTSGGTYCAVTVNTKGQVIKGQHVLLYATTDAEETSALNQLVIGGFLFRTI